MSTYLSDSDALDIIAGLLKSAGQTELLADAPYWESLVSRCNNSAYQEVLGQLLMRGFTKAQVDAWDRRIEFQRDLMIFWSLPDGAALESFSDLFLRSKDRRKDLTSVQVFANGAYVNPQAGGSAPGVCSFGPSSGAGTGQVFNWPDPNDPNLDQPTRW